MDLLLDPKPDALLVEDVVAHVDHAKLCLFSGCLLLEVVVVQADGASGLLQRVLLAVEDDHVLLADLCALGLQLLEELIGDALAVHGCLLETVDLVGLDHLDDSIPQGLLIR